LQLTKQASAPRVPIGSVKIITFCCRHHDLGNRYGISVSQIYKWPRLCFVCRSNNTYFFPLSWLVIGFDRKVKRWMH